MIAHNGQLAHGLTVEIAGSVECLGRAAWDVLFSGHPDSYDNVALVQRCGMDGFTFRTLIVRDRAGPVLVLPTFEATFDASTMADGPAGSVVRALAGLAPRLLRPRLLGVGLVECEWAAVGVRPAVESATLEAAWRLALASLEAAARLVGASATVLLDLNPDDLGRISGALLRAYAPVRTPRCGRVPLRFASVEQYLAGLSRSTRQGLRRKLRAGAAVRIERRTDITPCLDRILDLYRSTVERAPVVLGVQRPDYFRRAGAEVPGAHYVLYSLDDRLLAFNLLIERNSTLVDKYFCMDPALGRAHHLYFLSWVENIRYAIDRALTVYHAGPGSEETKRRLGCCFVQTRTLFRHTSALAHRLLALLARTVVGATPAPHTAGVVP